MRMPIQYAMSFPERVQSEFPRFIFDGKTDLSFEAPNTKVFKNLDLAYWALQKGGNMPCALNAANEIAVQLFLEEKISFLQMPILIENCLTHTEFIANPELEEFEYTDNTTRIKAFELYKNIKK
jgi:1-deoxy-D-xylulose-5-phosphate reductoisomerase